MKRYRFNLEAALRARRAQEDVARQRLAEVNHTVQKAWAAHRLAQDAYRAVTVSAAPVERDGFLAARAHEMRMADAVERARRTAVEHEVAAATLYAVWVEAGKRVASLERLDSRRRAEWQAGVQRDEAAAIDDVVASRWSLAAAQEKSEH